MTKRLKDLRTSLKTIDQADAAFATLAKAEIEMVRIDAEVEAEIAKLKAYAEAAKEHHVEQAEAARTDLAAFIEANPQEFEKPRKRKTGWGNYGLHTATKTHVFDVDAALMFCFDHNLKDAYKIVHKLIPGEARKLIETTHPDMPGIELQSGDVAICTVKKELLDQAKENS